MSLYLWSCLTHFTCHIIIYKCSLFALTVVILFIFLDWLQMFLIGNVVISFSYLLFISVTLFNSFLCLYILVIIMVSSVLQILKNFAQIIVHCCSWCFFPWVIHGWYICDPWFLFIFIYFILNTMFNKFLWFLNYNLTMSKIDLNLFLTVLMFTAHRFCLYAFLLYHILKCCFNFSYIFYMSTFKV